MTKFIPLTVLACVLSVAMTPAAMAEEGPAMEGAQASKGDQLFTSDGKRLGRVYRVTQDGDVQVIHNNRMLTIEGSTLSNVDGKLTTSLTRAELKGR